MKKGFLSILILGICLAAHPQNPRWAEFGIRIPAVTNLVVRWNTSTNSDSGSNVPTNAWHSTYGIYRLSEFHFLDEAVSNLLVASSLSAKDLAEKTDDEITFEQGKRYLNVSHASGTIELQTPEIRYSPTNLAQHVPAMKDIPPLVTNFFKMVGVPASEILVRGDGSPALNFSEPYTWFYVGDQTVTNVPFRTVVASRGVEGAQVIGSSGRCHLDFGESGVITKIQMGWPSFTKTGSAKTISASNVESLFRQGKAFQGFLPSNFDHLDWLSVKQVTVKQAWPCYFAGTTRRLYPFLAMWATVETGQGNVDLELDCPLIDESHIQQ